MAALDQGMARADVMLGFSESTEHAVLTQSWVLGDQYNGFGIAFS
jgi:hypothetical protein